VHFLSHDNYLIAQHKTCCHFQIFVEPSRSSSPAQGPGSEGRAFPAGTLMERWQIYYSPLAALHTHFAATGLTRSQMARFSPQGLYKRLTILVRSLYSFCRVLPAYRLYRAVRHGGGSGAFRLGYTIHSSLYTSPTTCATSSAQLPEHFSFTPIDTTDGQLHIGVDYAASSTVKVLSQGVSRVSPRPVPVFENYVDHASHSTSSPQVAKSFSPPQGGSHGAGGGGRVLARRSWSNSFRLSPARLGDDPSKVQEQTGKSAPSVTLPVQIPLKSAVSPQFRPINNCDVTRRPEMKSSGDLGALTAKQSGNALNEPFPDKPFSAPTVFLSGSGGQGRVPGEGSRSSLQLQQLEQQSNQEKGRSRQSPSPPARDQQFSDSTSGIPSGMDACSDIIKLPVGSITSSSPASPCSLTAYPTSCSPDLFFAFTPPLARFSTSVVSTSILSSGRPPSAAVRRHSSGLATSVSRSGDTNLTSMSRLGYSVSPPPYYSSDIYNDTVGETQSRQGQLLLTYGGNISGSGNISGNNNNSEPRKDKQEGQDLALPFDISMKKKAAMVVGMDSGALYDGDDEAGDSYGGGADERESSRSSVAAVGAFLGRVREAQATVDRVGNKCLKQSQTNGPNSIATAIEFLNKIEAGLDSDDA
jgi:hypothetical protein